jgi:hypothetical protein
MQRTALRAAADAERWAAGSEILRASFVIEEVYMSKKDQPDSFNETHHAMLFAWIARAIIERVGDQRGEAIIRKATRQYGEERGRRMALRAQANKHILSMTNYFGYADYKIVGEIDLKITKHDPHAMAFCIPKCPWHTAWKENNLLSFGRLYCLEIDPALVHGFNPELRVDVNATLPNGAAQCEFVYYDADLTIMNYLLVQYRKVVSPGARAVMHWDYHVGHLFSTLEKVAVGELGQVGQEAIEAGLIEFGGRYGEQSVQKVMSCRNKTYESLPE